VKFKLRCEWKTIVVITINLQLLTSQ